MPGAIQGEKHHRLLFFHRLKEENLLFALTFFSIDKIYLCIRCKPGYRINIR